MTVVIAPGPARSGIPRGTTPTASRSRVSSLSCCVSFDLGRSPCSISNATAKRRSPPATRNAGRVNPKAAKINWPKTAKKTSVLPATMHVFRITRCFSWAVRSSVRREKNGVTPIGSTTAKMEAMAVAPNATSTMVSLELERRVALLPGHQLHPAAGLVHGEPAADGGALELIPRDDFELVAPALREAKRVRPPHLAREEPFLVGDSPSLVEVDLAECRHVSIPFLRPSVLGRAQTSV